MRLDCPAALPLICPACRKRDENGWALHTVETAEVFVESAGEVIDGVLACRNCAQRFPIIDGIPILLKDLRAFTHHAKVAIIERDLHPSLVAMLDELRTDDYSQIVDYLSTYLDAHWGDYATPKRAQTFGFAPLAERLAARKIARVPIAVELGCGPGRGLVALATGADRVVGVERNFAALRRARRLLRGESQTFARRTFGSQLEPVTIAAPAAAQSIDLICGDALDPPLAPGYFDRVAALNLLDNVDSPSTLLAVLHTLVSKTGEVIVSSPYAFSQLAADEGFATHDPAAYLRGDLEKNFKIEEDTMVSWLLQRDDRTQFTYASHYVRASRRY